MAPSGAVTVLEHLRYSELTAFRLLSFVALKVTPHGQFQQETVKESISKPSCCDFDYIVQQVADFQTLRNLIGKP